MSIGGSMPCRTNYYRSYQPYYRSCQPYYPPSQPYQQPQQTFQNLSSSLIRSEVLNSDPTYSHIIRFPVSSTNGTIRLRLSNGIWADGGRQVGSSNFDISPNTVSIGGPNSSMFSLVRNGNTWELRVRRGFSGTFDLGGNTINTSSITSSPSTPPEARIEIPLARGITEQVPAHTVRIGAVSAPRSIFPVSGDGFPRTITHIRVGDNALTAIPEEGLPIGGRTIHRNGTISYTGGAEPPLQAIRIFSGANNPVLDLTVRNTGGL